MSAAFTPGPWKAHHDKHGFLNIVSLHRPYVAEVFGNNTFDPEQDANAKLIAAAPDLLAALLSIASIALMDNGHWAKTIELEAMEAINKALGEQL